MDIAAIADAYIEAAPEVLDAELDAGAVIITCAEPGCDASIATYGGALEHNEDGSHTFSYGCRREGRDLRRMGRSHQVSDDGHGARPGMLPHT